MEFGLALPILKLYRRTSGPWEAAAGPAALVAVARRAEALGYAWLAAVVGERRTEPLTALAFLAAATTRIRLLTHVLVLPYVNPIVAAKAAATLDFLAPGRLILGLGAGYLEREFRALGVPHRERGARLDEYIAILRALWSDDRPAYRGRFYAFERIHFAPRPTAAPPLWIGGDSPAALRRAARLGDGWLPWQTSAEALAGRLAGLRARPDSAARESPFAVVVRLDRLEAAHPDLAGGADPWSPSQRAEIPREIERLRQAGATGAILIPGYTRSLEEFLERVEWFAESVIVQSG
jgi:probable F420-dependent oxidoreductase